MKRLVLTSAYKRDVKRLKHQQKPLNLLGDIVDSLIHGIALHPHFHDHALKGKWIDCRELHIAPDWLLIYHIEDDTVYLDRTGSHSELFD